MVVHFDKTQVLRSEEHTSELQSPCNLVCRLLLEKKNVAFEQERHSPRHECAEALPPRAPEQEADRVVGQFFFFLNDRAPPEIYPLPLPDALPIFSLENNFFPPRFRGDRVARKKSFREP